MFELKYFATIDRYEREERNDSDPRPLPPFDINVLGSGGLLGGATRRFTRWFVLFAFWVLRAVWPVACIGRLVIVSRYDDVRDVLARPLHFKVPFGPEMRALTGGADFLLGQDGPEHDAQREILEAVVLRSDAQGILDNTRTVTELLLRNSGGRIDIMQDLLGRVFTETCSDYFGLDLDEPDAFADRTMSISALIFADPFGNEETRKLALNGAVRIRWLIDRAIDRAEAKPRPNTVIDRLVQYRRPDGTPGGTALDKPQIRAMAIGTIIGLIPTNTLGAGKMIEELQRRGMLQSLIGAASAAEKARSAGDVEAAKRHRGELKKMLVEASRLNPALFPGQFRHVPKATTVGGKPVPAGSVMVVGTMSALRDSRKFENAGAFVPGRELDPALMFGEGSHVCLGAHLAMEQITEICQILFSQPGLRLAPDPDGWLAYVGPFPRRLDVVFQPMAQRGGTSATQNLITIQARLDPDKVDEAKKLIETLGNPAALDSPIGRALAATEIVHFVSLSALDAKDPDDKEAAPDPRLILELNVDGDADTVLERIVQHAGPLLEPIFRCIAGAREIDPDRLPERFNKSRLHFLLERHKTKLHFAPWGAIGLNFNGTPDTPVGDIARQEELATFVRKAVDRYFQVHEGMRKRAVDSLAYVRDLTRPAGASVQDLARLSPAERQVEEELRAEGRRLRPFLIRPTRRRLKISDWTGDDTKIGLQGLPEALKSNAGVFLGLLIGTTVCLFGSAIHHAVDPDSWVAFAFALLGVTSGLLLTVALAVRDGFDTLVRWWKAWTGRLIVLGTVLAFVLAAVGFIAALLVRWFRWPASILGFAVASFLALQRCFPDMFLVWQIPLAALGGVAATWLIVGFWKLVVPRLLQAWRMVVLAVVGAAVAFGALQPGLLQGGLLQNGWLDLPLSGRIALAALAGVAAAHVVRALWTWAQPLLRRNRLLIEWLLGLGAVAGIVVAICFYPAPFLFVVDQVGAVSLALAGGLVATFLFWLTVLLVFVAILYWHEVRDDKDIDRRTAPLDHIEKIAATENAPGYAQNHITAVTAMKPGAFRKFTLALALWAIGKEVQYWFRPGFVLNMGTIHYARWFRLPGSEMMLFFSNYDGSWLSYLEDFITKAHEGQTAVWSHGKGFPKTRLLLLGGAADGARFKRWVRRQQVVTQFWYSRFPSLTTDQIRTNALIHDGLMRAQTDTAARAWLDCFGTMPRPQDAIETDEVQALVFRGFPSHDYMLCAALALPDDNQGGRAARKDWLTYLRREVAFGEHPDVADRTATFVAFSARGMATCLGRTAEDQAEKMAAFPPVFRLGMADRARVLGDTGPSAPKDWQWADVDRADVSKAGAGKAVDAMLFIYGKDAQACRDALATHEAKLGRKAIWTLLTEPTQKTKEARAAATAGAPERDAPMFEHFGFRDGISQPILRGTEREAATYDKADVVEVGELILGYRDGAGYFPPAVTLPAESDPADELETDTPEFPSRFPRFDGSRDSDLRDFGRNGLFVAVRQLMQDVDGFNDFLAVQEGELNKYPGLGDSIGGEITQEWIAAKMMGRWRSGASLICHPHEMAGRKAPDKADNDFNFATDDPQGLRCPFGAHIRRSNPRGSLAPNDPNQAMIERRHRILRRGRPYGDEKSEKGMLFVALCADLERQFEFLQQSWVGSANFQGLSNEPDPITSPPPVDPGKPFVFTIPTPSGSVTMKNLKSFVTVRAGGYFFMPSRSAIRFLAGL
ncbi:MAG: cytochrome P450 [Reyranella sp.]|nr:cytochrome P450 [Reyranella sp.]